MTRSTIALMMLLAGASLAACSRTKPPTAELLGISVGQRTDEAVVLDLQVELTNPNERALALQDLEYSFSVEGARVFDGRRAAQATLPAHGWQHLSVPVVVRFGDLATPDGRMPAVFSYHFHGRLEYLAPGAFNDMLRDTGLWRPALDISEEGEAQLGE